MKEPHRTESNSVDDTSGKKTHLLPLRAFVGLGASGPPSPAPPAPPPSSALLPNGVMLAPSSPAAADELPLPADGGVADAVASSLCPFELASALLPSPPKAARRAGADDI